MKHILPGVALLIGLAACGSLTVDPAQNAINKTTEACKAVGVAVGGVDAAVLTNSIKKAQAQQALDALRASNLGCGNALTAIKSGTAASGVK